MLNFVDSRPRWVRLTFILGVWTIMASCFAAGLYVAYSSGKQAVAWNRVVVLDLTYWYLVAALAPAVLWLSRRFPLDRQHWPRNAAIHMLLGGLFSVAHSGVYLTISIFLLSTGDDNAGLSPMDLVRLVFSLNLAFRFLTYSLIVTISHAFDYHQRYREGELKTAQLEASLALAQLQALKTQLHPHFLFNTLNSISALVHRDPESADKMIAKLGHLLRLTLEFSSTHTVTLRQELEFLGYYLDIQKVRFRERLQVQHQIEPDSLDAVVPHLILQPIVENAIGHGIEPYDSVGKINIRAKRRDGRLTVQVEDNGPGLLVCGIPGNKVMKDFIVTTGNGIGLANTQNRLMHLYGKSHKFDLCNAPRGGFLVSIEIPFCRAPLVGNNS
jgi:two-component system LytT family sensor kinase